MKMVIGHDFDDASWKMNGSRILEEYASDINLEIVQVDENFSSEPCYVWNFLYKTYIDEFDYFFQTGDDIEYLGPFLAPMVHSLQQRVCPDIGVVGPRDESLYWSREVLTQTMVSRKHYKIFHYLFPPEFRNWYGDFWIANVYIGISKCPDAFQMLGDIKVVNPNRTTRRYNDSVIFIFEIKK